MGVVMVMVMVMKDFDNCDGHRYLVDEQKNRHFFQDSLLQRPFGLHHDTYTRNSNQSWGE